MKKTILIAFGVVVVALVLWMMKQQGFMGYKAGGPVASGRDTPIVITGGSIHADTNTSAPAGWARVSGDTSSYTAVIDPTLNATVQHIVVTDTSDNEKNRYPTGSTALGTDWKIEITEVDTSNSAATPKAITISPDLSNDSSGRTLKVTISKKPAPEARWDENPPTDIRFRGDPKNCKPDTAADPLDHCDKLSSIQVTLGGVPQTAVPCETSPSDGKCKIKLKIAD